MPDVALALGVGGIKGIAHIGVLRALERNGFSIKAISGSSAGGMVGAVYAAGNSPDRIIHIVNQLDQNKLFELNRSPHPALMDIHGLTKILSEVIGELTFADLAIPFACTTVNIHKSQELVLSEGRLMEAVLATIAIPGVFPPRQLDDAFLVDGGLLNPVPVSVARWLNPTLPVIAVSLFPSISEGISQTSYRLPSSTPIPTAIMEYLAKLKFGQAMEIFLTSMEVTSLMLTDLRLKAEKPEVIIRPDVTKFGILDQVEPRILIEIGEKAVEDALPQIKEALGWQNTLLRRFRRPTPPARVIGFPQDHLSSGLSE